MITLSSEIFKMIHMKNDTIKLEIKYLSTDNQNLPRIYLGIIMGEV